MAEELRIQRQKELFESSHRRVRSNSYRVLSPRHLPNHQRTYSGSAALSKPLSQDRAPFSVPRRDHRGLSTEASSPPTSPQLTQRKSGRGLLGTLDAAILYFETVQRVPFIPTQTPDEVTYLREELKRMSVRTRTLEQNAALLMSEKAYYQRQREAYERHIGTLNTRLLDLQMTLNEYRERLKEDSLDLSDVPQVWASPR